MTDAEKPTGAEPLSDAATRAAQLRLFNRRRFPLAAVLVPPIIILGVYAAFMMLQMRMTSGATVTPNMTAVIVQLEQRVASDEQKIQELEAKLNDLGSNNASATTNAMPPSEAPAATQLRSDFAALSATVSALQAGMKQAGSAATEIWQSTQNRISASVAFIQLRADADAGRAFGQDLTQLRVATVGDAAVQGPLAALDPYAAKGVANLDSLREEFERLEGPATVAVDKATAQSWRERLVAELKGLISVRPLHGAPTVDTLATAENALAVGDLAAALDAVRQLPPEAQEVFRDWQKKVEARMAVNQALQAIANHLAVPVTTPAQDKP
jgi:hypothetical protein